MNYVRLRPNVSTTNSSRNRRSENRSTCGPVGVRTRAINLDALAFIGEFDFDQSGPEFDFDQSLPDPFED